MAGINKAILVGNLGKDPEFKYTPSGQPVATFSLATSERFTDKNGQRQDRTEWHNIVVWGKLAEIANQFLKKGRTVYIEGRITTRSWDDKDGNKKYKTEIVASVVEFIGTTGGGASGSGASDDHPANFPSSYDQAPMNNTSNSRPDTMVEEDLPF
jgi:single-strand DNA-binding protein